MTGLAVGNQNLSNILDSIHDTDANFDGSKKVMLSGNGAITESKESRGIFTSKSIKNLITERTQVSVNILKNALTDAIGLKGLEIFNRFISAKNLSGKQRITLQNLANIKRAVNDYRSSQAQQNVSLAKKLDLSNIKALSHKQTFYVNVSDVESQMARNFMGLCKSHPKIRDEISLTCGLLKNIPKDFTGSAIKGEHAFEKLEKILLDAKDKLQTARDRLDTLLQKVGDGADTASGDFADASETDLERLRPIVATLQEKIDSIMSGMDKNIQNCQIAKNNDGKIYKNFKDGFSVKIQAALQTIQEARDKISQAKTGSNSQKFIGKCDAAIGKLDAMKNNYQSELARLESYNLRDEDSVPKSFLKLFKEMGGEAGREIKNLVNSLKIQGYKLDKQCVMNKFAEIMGAKDCWKQNITRDLSMNVGHEQKNFRIDLTPAKKMNPSLYGAGMNGNPSTAQQSPDLINCFKSAIYDSQGNKLFTGYRHGILDSIKVENENQRLEYGKNKARQLLTTILLDRHSNQLNQTSRDNPLQLNLTSVSLVTPFSIFGQGEKTMAENHMKALESLTKDADGNIEPIKLNINNTEVWVKVNLRTFLSPCNKYSHGAAGRLIWSNANSIGKNSDSFSQLFGSNFLQRRTNVASLKAEANFDNQFNEFKRNIDANSDVGRFLKKPDLSLADKKKVFVLCQEINLLMQNSNYRNAKIDAFELPARIALLNDMIGNVCCYNCKSGKDRTGHLDIVTKQLAVKLTELDKKSVGAFMRNDSSVIRGIEGRSYSTTNDIQNFDLLAKKSGNLEIHQMNTGLKGSKVNNLAGVVNHFGGNELFKYYGGASKFVKS